MYIYNLSIYLYRHINDVSMRAKSLVINGGSRDTKGLLNAKINYC